MIEFVPGVSYLLDNDNELSTTVSVVHHPETNTIIIKVLAGYKIYTYYTYTTDRWWNRMEKHIVCEAT